MTIRRSGPVAVTFLRRSARQPGRVSEDDPRASAADRGVPAEACVMPRLGRRSPESSCRRRFGPPWLGLQSPGGPKNQNQTKCQRAQIPLDRARRSPTGQPLWSAVTGPNATPSDEIVLRGMEKGRGSNSPAGNPARTRAADPCSRAWPRAPPGLHTGDGVRGNALKVRIKVARGRSTSRISDSGSASCFRLAVWLREARCRG